jgi:uncharacterized membrane protein YeaQ/YmgE (transglycosylase-associated protein family)
MQWIYMFIIGIVIGAIARFLLPGPQPMGILKTGLFGVGGSLVAGGINQLVRGVPFEAGGFIVSILGAMALLWIGQRMQKRS